jgi:putative selenium metabolism hydrolase
MEEWCDGIAPHAFVEHEGIRPDFVVIGEPTKMQVYRGHKGRVEIEVISRGRSAHAASNHLGDNAIYKVLPLIEGVSKLEPQLGDDPFLGHGKITVSDMKVSTPVDQRRARPGARLHRPPRHLWRDARKAHRSRCALVPQALLDNGDITVEMMKYADPSYTGFVFPVDKYFPAWALDENIRWCRLAWKPRADRPARTSGGKWNFSTNGIYWMGKAGIPSIGFGPGEEETAHTTQTACCWPTWSRRRSFTQFCPR